MCNTGNKANYTQYTYKHTYWRHEGLCFGVLLFYINSFLTIRPTLLVTQHLYKFTTVDRYILSVISEICYIRARYNEGLLYFPYTFTEKIEFLHLLLKLLLMWTSKSAVKEILIYLYVCAMFIQWNLSSLPFSHNHDTTPWLHISTILLPLRPECCLILIFIMWVKLSEAISILRDRKWSPVKGIVGGEPTN